MTARLTLICHGSTEAVRRAAFPRDEPLDDRGKAHAAELVAHLPRGDRCWTGAELRARQTAEALGLSASVQPMLRECDYGRWAGKTLTEIAACEPQAVDSWLNDPAAAPHGGEDGAGYHLFCIDNKDGRFGCEMIARARGANGVVGEAARQKLF